MTVVGRERELAAISGLLQPDRDDTRVVLVEGAAGIGKTTLWNAVADAEEQRGHRVLRSAADHSEAQWSFIALRDLLSDAFDDVADELPAPQRHALEVVLLRNEPSGPPPELGAIGVGFLSTLRALATREPTLLAIDDVQWLDTASAAPLSYALRRLPPEPVRCLVARRADEPGDPLGLDRLEGSRVERLRLEGLTIGAVGRMLHERLGVAYPRPTLQRVHAVSDGNPFFALELARALGTTPEPLRPGAPLPVPGALHDLVAKRLSALPPETLDALAIAAALSRPSTEIVSAALGRDARESLGPAIAAGLVHVYDEEIGFEHPLYAAAVYDRAAGGIGIVHGRLAELVPDLEERARHLALSTDEPSAEASQVLEEASRAAFARGSPTAASELMAEARRLTPTGDPSAGNRAALEVDYRFEAGETTRAAAMLEELVASSAPGSSRARLLSRQARIGHFGDDIRRSIQVLYRALAEVGDDDALRSEIEEGLAWGLLLLRHDLEAACKHGRSAADLAEARGDLRALAEGLAAAAVTGFVLGHPWEESMARALELEPHMAGTRVLRYPSFAHGYCLSCSDRLDEARATFQQLVTWAEERGDEGSMPSLLNHLALIECLAGRHDEAATLGDECFERALESDQRPTQASVLGKLALLAARRGAVDEARELAARSLAIAGGGTFDADRPEAAMARGGETAIWALGFLELSLDDPELADRQLAPLCRSLLAAGVEEPGEIRCLPDEVEALTGLGRLDEAEALLRRLEEWAARLARPSALAAAGRCRALLLTERGNLAAALGTVADAASWAARSELPFEHGRTLLDRGTHQRRARQRRAARESLQQAVAIFDGLGAAPWAAKARAELSRIGGRSPSDGALTPTETRVAELVALGMSNKEAAAALVVSVHTVEAALTSIYRKLDVRSRTELARRLADPA